MTVAFLINGLGYGGAERVFVDDANAFVQAGDQALVVLLYEQPHPLLAELDPRVQVVHLQARGPFDLRAVRKARKILQTSGADALVATLNDSIIMARWIALVPGVSSRLYIREPNTVRRKARWQQALDIVFAWVPQRIIAVSQDAKDSLPWPARARAVVLRNAVALPPESARTASALVNIVTVGSLTPQKDHATLLTALGKVASTGIQFTVSIIGSGPLHRQLLTEAQRLGLSEQVTFLGLLPHAEVTAKLATADLFVLTSRWEGCPNVVLEAMAAGLPVVATSVGGVPELVVDGETGALSPPGSAEGVAEALICLIQDAALRQQYGGAARLRASRQFSPEARLRALRAILSS